MSFVCFVNIYSCGVCRYIFVYLLINVLKGECSWLCFLEIFIIVNIVVSLLLFVYFVNIYSCSVCWYIFVYLLMNVLEVKSSWLRLHESSINVNVVVFNYCCLYVLLTFILVVFVGIFLFTFWWMFLKLNVRSWRRKRELYKCKHRCGGDQGENKIKYLSRSWGK